MRINLAKSAGFCFGVKRAIDIALKAAETENKVEMLGDIVHNEYVVRNIHDAGIRKISRLAKGQNKMLLIRAHGAPAKIYKKAKALGYKIIDATCPMVKEIHRIAKKTEKEGYRIIIIGDKAHDEVNGIKGHLKTKAIVIDNENTVPFEKIKKIKKACVVVQSTQNTDSVIKIVATLKQHIKNLVFCNTVCKPTKVKQKEIKKMPKENDVMIIIGSKTSANTRRLYEISKAINPRSYWIQSGNDVKPAWLKEAKSVGITAGASTPDYITEKTISFIKKMKLSS